LTPESEIQFLHAYQDARNLCKKITCSEPECLTAFFVQTSKTYYT